MLEGKRGRVIGSDQDHLVVRATERLGLRVMTLCWLCVWADGKWEGQRPERLLGQGSGLGLRGGTEVALCFVSGGTGDG